MFTGLKNPPRPEAEHVVLNANLANLPKNAQGAQTGDWCHIIDKGIYGRFESSTNKWYDSASGAVIV